MRQISSNIIRDVQAQESDAVALPTFTSSLDFEALLGTEASEPVDASAEASFELSKQEGSVAVGDILQVQLLLDTADIPIASFTAEIEFDPEYLRLVDADADLEGTQAEILTTDFTITENTVNNQVGAITIKAEAATAAEFQAALAQLQFEILQEGNTAIVLQNASSSVLTENSENILSGGESLQITLGAGGTAQGQSSGGSNGLTENVLPQGEIEEIKELPESDLPFTGILSLFLGAILLIVGFKLRSKYFTRKY